MVSGRASTRVPTGHKKTPLKVLFLVTIIVLGAPDRSARNNSTSVEALLQALESGELEHLLERPPTHS